MSSLNFLSHNRPRRTPGEPGKIRPSTHSIPAATRQNDAVSLITPALWVALREKDEYTAAHCARVADLAEGIGRALNIPEEDLRSLHNAGLLHDVGKIGIPDGVLLKHGGLDAHEWGIMRTHSARGERILMAGGGAVPDAIIKAVRHHHEHFDGSGYPDGLVGEGIPFWSRILLLADSYDAMTTTRSYRQAFSHDKAIEIMVHEVGTRSDPIIFEAFEHLIKTNQLRAFSTSSTES